MISAWQQKLHFLLEVVRLLYAALEHYARKPLPKTPRFEQKIALMVAIVPARLYCNFFISKLGLTVYQTPLVT